MSEFTDYLIYHATSTTIAALRQEVMAVAGPATLIYPELPELDEAEAGRAFAAREGARWVALVTDTDPAQVARNSGRTVAQIFVLEDFASWRLTAYCPGQAPVTVYLGGEDGYAAGWFRANYRFEPPMRAEVAPRDVAPLAACFALEEQTVRDLVRYDGAWDFLTVLGAPVMQMADQGLIRALGDKTGGEPRFGWEVWPENVETEDK